MSRQPMGILASSPELMNVVQQRQQPVQMAQGGPVNVNDTISNQLMAIQQLRGMGDRATLNNIAADKRLPRSVQMAAANALAGIEPKDDGPIEQVPLAQTDKLPSLTAPPVMSVRGSGEGPPAETQKSTLFDNQVMSGSSMPLETLNRIRAARGMAELPTTTEPDVFVRAARKLSPTGKGIAEILGENQAETERLMSQGDETSAMLTDPSTLLPQISGATAEKPEEKKKAEKPKPNPTAAAEALLVDPTTLLPQISDITKADTSEKKKADAVDEALNITGTRKERTEQRYQMLKDLLGDKKAKDIRTDANYNLMMAGLMIAAGESPDAATNIAKGLAAGLKGYGEATGEAAQEASKEEKALKLMAAKEVGEEMTAEQAASIRAAELADTRGFQRELKKTEIDAAFERANIPSATQRMYEQYLTPEEKTSVLTTSKEGGGPKVPVRERFITDSLSKTESVDAVRADLAAQGNKNPSMTDITRQLGVVYDNIMSSIPSAPQTFGSTDHIAKNNEAKKAGNPTYTLGGKTFKVQ